MGISFNQWQQNRSANQDNGIEAPLAELAENGYSYSSFIYPLDLGAPGAGKDHYMVFHINENSITQFTTATGGGVSGGPVGQPTITANSLKNQQNGKGTTLYIPENQNGTTPTGQQGNDAQPQSYSSVPSQTIRRVATTIVLPMPQDIQVNYHAEWQAEDVGVAADFTNMARGTETTLGDVLKSGGASAAKHAGTMLNQFTNLNMKAALSLSTGLVVNPHQEVIFDGIGFRSFNFTFRFTPESEAEALNVDNIIRAFKFYSAPEILQGTAGRFWIYPAEFDIQYYSNGKENEFLNKISTCALTDMTVNYTSAGHWAGFRPHSKLNGSPSVCTDIQLTFKELEIITKERILENYSFIPLWFIPLCIRPIIMTLHEALTYMTHLFMYKPMPVYIETWCIIAILLLTTLMGNRILDSLQIQLNGGVNINVTPLVEKAMRSMKQFGNMVLNTLHLK